jgi:hypothetical protein
MAKAKKNSPGKKSATQQRPTPSVLVATDQAMLNLVNHRAPPDPTLALVIQLTARLEEALRLLLQCHMDPLPTSPATRLLDPFGGALGTGAARADACRAFSFISERCHSDIKAILKVRNIFAHHYLPLRFDDPEVKKWCDKLTLYQPHVNSKIESGLRAALEPRVAGFKLVASQIYYDITRWVHWQRPGLGGEMLPVDFSAPVPDRGEEPPGKPFRTPLEHLDDTRLFGP